jgi:hypothetical protein
MKVRNHKHLPFSLSIFNDDFPAAQFTVKISEWWTGKHEQITDAAYCSKPQIKVTKLSGFRAEIYY